MMLYLTMVLFKYMYCWVFKWCVLLMWLL